MHEEDEKFVNHLLEIFVRRNFPVKQLIWCEFFDIEQIDLQFSRIENVERDSYRP